jgi:hypothetical protein
MSDKIKVKVLKGIVVDGDHTIENGAEGLLAAADAEALAAAEIVEIVVAEKPAKAEKKAKEKDDL